MSVASIIICIVLILVSIALIIAVLMQQGQREGLGSIAGGAETFFGKNKANSAEGKLKNLTKILAAVFVVLAIVATIVTAHGNNNPSTPAPVDAEATEEPAEGETEDAADATEAPAEATEAPAEATDAPVEATDAPVEATDAPVEPTDAPETEPTATTAA